MDSLLLKKATDLRSLVVWFTWLQMCVCVLGSEEVYFDKFWHCTKTTPFDLSEEEYEVKSKGGGFSHETLDCSISFKASAGYGVCVTYDDFSIEDCSVRFFIYETKDESGEVWKELSCGTKVPNQMCTSERYVTIRVLKKWMNNNEGYEIDIKVKQSSSVTDEGVVFASIGLVVGITCGVAVFVIVIALVVYCCCQKKGASTSKHSVNDYHLQPSAPPLLEAENHPSSTAQSFPLYPHLQDNLDPPPPYDLPPSYSPPHNHDS